MEKIMINLSERGRKFLETYKSENYYSKDSDAINNILLEMENFQRDLKDKDGFLEELM